MRFRGLLAIGFLSSTVSVTASADVTRRQVPADVPTDALVAYAMDPQTSATNFCKDNLDAATKADPKTKNTCGPFVHKARIKPAGPWKSIAVVQLDEHSSSGIVPLEHHIEMIVQLDARWFSFGLGHVPETAASKHAIELRSIVVKDVIRGGTPELVVELTRIDHDGGSTTKTESILVCGVGKSGAPSCVGVVTGEDDNSSVGRQRYQLAWSFDRAGRLVLRAKTPWPKALQRSDYEMKRPLYFL